VTDRSRAGRRKQVRQRVPSKPVRRALVTAVIPAYNYARYLGECAASVLTQRDVDVRIIIVDDCSTDDTPLVTAQLADADHRVSVIRNEPNLGHIPSVNLALNHVETEYVVKLDADDLLAPGALARATALLEARPEVGFVYGRPRHFTGAVPRPVDRRARSWTVWPGAAWVARLCRGGTNVISQPEVVIRTDALRRVLPIRAELPHTSDLHLWMQLASIRDVGRVNGPVQACYRVHEASLQRTIHSGSIFDLVARRDAFDSIFVAEGATLEGASELHALAHQTLAASALDAACRAYDRGRTATAPVDGFVTFALETWPRARELREWRALERRRRVGACRAPKHPRFFADALRRRALDEVCRWRWQRTGEMGPLPRRPMGVV
jgi:hypothetical protein